MKQINYRSNNFKETSYYDNSSVGNINVKYVIVIHFMFNVCIKEHTSKIK